MTNEELLAALSSLSPEQFEIIKKMVEKLNAQSSKKVSPCLACRILAA